jgi:hypothetical protein
VEPIKTESTLPAVASVIVWFTPSGVDGKTRHANSRENGNKVLHIGRAVVPFDAQE